MQLPHSVFTQTLNIFNVPQFIFNKTNKCIELPMTTMLAFFSLILHCSSHKQRQIVFFSCSGFHCLWINTIILLHFSLLPSCIFRTKHDYRTRGPVVVSKGNVLQHLQNFYFSIWFNPLGKIGIAGTMIATLQTKSQGWREVAGYLFKNAMVAGRLGGSVG